VDLTPGNTLWSRGRPLVILDWDRARRSCAALSMDKLMEPLTLLPPSAWAPEARTLGARLKARYLRSWGRHRSAAAWRALDVAMRLAAVRDLDRVVTNLLVVGREHRVPLDVRAYLHRYRHLWAAGPLDAWTLPA
jgi:hypothetical protein